MSFSNTVTWSLVLLPENAEKIDQINQIILGSSYSAKTLIENEPKLADHVHKKEPAEDEGISQSDLQAAAKAAKTEHGIAFVKECIEANKGTLKRGLNQSLSSIPPNDHASFIQALKAGVTEDWPDNSKSAAGAAAYLSEVKTGVPDEEQASDGLKDDGFDDAEDSLDDDDDDDDDDAEEAPTVEAVKAALKAYAKETGREEAKQIMNDNGAAKLQNVDDCTPAQLTAMFKVLV